eukprot:Plantae.Rhodophyta-Palmaria_palmata.ctg9966.p2 GENE.Plantae.Rhodophyta-Palmaria_palmata.ctg9966~~Plantae.Rhodophyta-Palmaria_palmata.ctg9966.p2  ORF type:complete len:102 (-),score=2.44 Plantae.Rhodophyta-Palmaria_palmata.ctg9966:543-848(-)
MNSKERTSRVVSSSGMRTRYCFCEVARKYRALSSRSWSLFSFGVVSRTRPCCQRKKMAGGLMLPLIRDLRLLSFRSGRLMGKKIALSIASMQAFDQKAFGS